MIKILEFEHNHSQDFNYTYSTDKEITQVTSSCGCTTPKVTSDSVEVNIRYNSLPSPQIHLPTYTKGDTYIKEVSVYITYVDESTEKLQFKIKVLDA